ncbi:MAG: hypothetical protein NTV80_04445 [Verrucomicrobia bacterium]|nr:hypothetical protein [Verrucomicrobiota bacterium]
MKKNPITAALPKATISHGLELPYRRWFYCLAIGVLLTLLQPYFTTSGTTVWTPEIQTFTMTGTSFMPTTDRIYIDGHTYAMIASRNWLAISVAWVFIEALGLVLNRLYLAANAKFQNSANSIAIPN